MAMKLEKEIEELKKQVAALQARVKVLAAKCDAKESAPAASGDWLDRRTFKIWQKKVAQKLGWEI